MVSRRKILSRSRDELHSDIYFMNEDDEEDIWYSKEKLYRDHIQEVIDKWDSIDDEIWAKVIVLERNRRVAKAYARAPVITVNGSTDGFDGFRIGVAGFDNPLRDSDTSAAIQALGLGLKLKMDDVGNVLVKRISRGAAVSVKNTTEESAVSNDILKLHNSILKPDEPYKVFDMKKFQQNMSRELKRSNPDRIKLENQCISAIAFGGFDMDETSSGSDGSSSMPNESLNRDDPLRAPLWILVINIVAMEMLRSKLPPGTSRYRAQSAPGPLSLIPASQMGLRPFGSGSSDEDPYSVAGSGSSGSSGNNNRNGKGSTPPADRPPKLPPRDNPTSIYGASIWARPLESQLRYAEQKNANVGGGHNSRKDGNNNKTKAKRSTGDDPYYCGLRARIPNFVKRKKKSSDSSGSSKLSSKMPSMTTSSSLINLGKAPQPQQHQQQQMASHHPFWWHSRLYSDNSGQFSLGPHAASNGPADNHPRIHPMNSMMPYIPTDSSDSDYSHIYGRLPIPTRGIRKFPAKPLFLSHWE